MVSYSQNLLPTQYAHIPLIGSRSKVFGRHVAGMVGVFFILDEDRLDFPIAAFEIIQLNTPVTLRIEIHIFVCRLGCVGSQRQNKKVGSQQGERKDLEAQSGQGQGRC